MSIPSFHVGVRKQNHGTIHGIGKIAEKTGLLFGPCQVWCHGCFPLPGLDDPIPPARAQTGRCLLSYLGLSRIAGCGMISLDLMGF